MQGALNNTTMYGIGSTQKQVQRRVGDAKNWRRRVALHVGGQPWFAYTPTNDELDREVLETNGSKRFMREVRYYLGRKRRGTCEQQTNSSEKSSYTDFSHF